MMSYYQMALKNREKALHYFRTAKELEPTHPNILYLEKKLYKVSPLKRLLPESEITAFSPLTSHSVPSQGPKITSVLLALRA